MIALAKEITDWLGKYGEELDKPYESETVIGVYGYKKQTASKVGGGSSIIGWQDQFAKRRNRWRRISL